MVKRGVSMAEKRTRLKDILATKLSPMTLKEMEKLGMKAGVNSMSIKGILTELADDNEIEMDKIGSSNYFWYFPSKMLWRKQVALQKLHNDSSRMEDKISTLQLDRDNLLTLRKDSKERRERLDKFKGLQLSNKILEDKIFSVQENERKIKLATCLEKAEQSAKKWTENTWAMSDYLKKNFMMQKADINKQLRINDDFDYPIYKPPKATKRRG